jgi:UDP-N-acetylmuramoylalanine--D-glutamate ligase
VFAARSFAGKSVAVFGLARSGISCALALQLGGAKVLAWDDAAPSVDKAAAEGVTTANLHDLNFADIDALVLSPGVPLTHPEPHWSVLKAKAAGVEIIGDTEIFCREMEGSGARLVCITGTNGKSTTSALVHHVFKSAGIDVHLPEPKAGRVYVLELSSFQLDLMPRFRPDVGILTNLTPDHLDRHGSMEHYATVKAKMFERQKAEDVAIIGVDDEWCEAIADDVAGRGLAVQRVSVARRLENGISVADGVIMARARGQTELHLDIRGCESLRGRHNWQNAAIAFAAGRACGLTVEAMAVGMKSFPGLAHRMQQVARRGNVVFVNDSKATNADAAEKALASFERIYWITGGVAKAGGITPLLPLMWRVKKAYLIGLAARDFSATLAGHADCVIVETLEKAVTLAAADAELDRGNLPVVLLSPACSSFDQFKNFEVRGDAFVDLVAKLTNVELKVEKAA